MNKTESNAALLERSKAGDKTADEELIRENMALIKSIAVRFTGRGQDLDDLIQIGSIGMLKAIRGYNKSFGTAFSTYAVPLISGEIKRFLRDDGMIKVSREAKKNNCILQKSAERFEAEKGRKPSIAELCEISGIDIEDALYALNACSPMTSLQDKIGDDDGHTFEEVISDNDIVDVTEKIALRQAIETLDERDKAIIYMRYYAGLTQNEVAGRLGMTQVRVSRAEKKIIGILKEELHETG